MAKIAFVVLVAGLTAVIWDLAQAQSNPGYSAADERRGDFDELLAAFRAFDRQAKSDSPDYASLESDGARMQELLRVLPTWFPAGSGAESGARTNAKPEIWKNWDDFRAKAFASVAAVQALKASVRTRNPETIRSAEQAVRGTCNTCHRAYEYGYF